MTKFEAGRVGVGRGLMMSGGRSGSGPALNAQCMQRLRRAIGGGFERGFIGFVEAFFVIGEGKFGGMISGRLLTSGVMPQCGRRGYSVLRNSAMAMASMASPMAATMARDSPTGTTQPNQVMPGLRACTARGLTDRWSNTACRIGTTM